MFIRTSSKAFGGTKSKPFKCSLTNSYQFNGNRSVLIGTAFSYGINFSAGYTFMPDQSVERGFRGIVVNYNEVASSLLNGTGLYDATFKFDGSGDSGDFSLEGLSTPIENVEVFQSAGVLEATKPSHDLVIHTQTNWRSTFSADKTFENVLETIAYGQLESEYGGWEINSGSHGEVVLSPDEGVRIDYNNSYYHCDGCDEDYDDDNPCSCIKCADCYELVEDGVCTDCGAKQMLCEIEDCDTPTTDKNPICWSCQKDHKKVGS